MKNIRILGPVAFIVCAVGVALAWLFGAFDESNSASGMASSAPKRVETTTPHTASSAPVSAPSFTPPSVDLGAELTSIGYAYDVATGTWRAIGSTGLPVFVLDEGSERIVRTQLDNLICDAPPPFDRRPSALVLAMNGAFTDAIPASASVALPVRITYSASGVVVATFTCYRK